MTGRAVAVWLGIAVLAIANGAFREAVLLPRVGETAARAISTLLLADYNIVNGRIWIVVLIVTLLAPVAAAFRGRFS